MTRALTQARHPRPSPRGLTADGITSADCRQSEGRQGGNLATMAEVASATHRAKCPEYVEVLRAVAGVVLLLVLQRDAVRGDLAAQGDAWRAGAQRLRFAGPQP